MSLVSGISGAGPIAIWGVDVCSSAEGSELFVGKKKTHVHSLDARILYCLLFSPIVLYHLSAHNRGMLDFWICKPVQ